MSLIDGEGNPLAIGDTPFNLAECRDVALPKKQVKSLESVLFIPQVPSRSRSVSTKYGYNAGQGGRGVVEFSPERLMGFMPSWQYYLLILARTPEAYQYVQKLDSIRPPSSLDNVSASYYRVAMLGSRSTAGAAVARQPVDEHRLRAMGRRIAHRVGPGAATGDARLAALGRAVDPQRSRHARRPPRQFSSPLSARSVGRRLQAGPGGTEGTERLFRQGDSAADAGAGVERHSLAETSRRPNSCRARANCWPNAAWDEGESWSPPSACPSETSPTGPAATRSSAPCCFATRRESTSLPPTPSRCSNGRTTVERLDAGRVTGLRYFARDAGVPLTNVRRR